MSKNRTVGLVLIIVGVVANNYVYLHDILFDKHAGVIYMGWKSLLAAAATLVVIALGVLVLARSRATVEPSATPHGRGGTGPGAREDTH